MSKEKPISYTAEMILAKREGRKIVTRRVIKHEGLDEPNRWTDEGWNADSRYRTFTAPPDGVKWQRILVKSPYQVGDLLWTKEAWWDLGHMEHGKWQGRIESHTVKPRYVASCPDPFAEGIGGIVQPVKINWKQTSLFNSTWRKRSSRFMPKWVARDWDEVVSVRAERLQEITEEEAIAEGIQLYEYGTEYDKDYGCREKNMAYSVGYGTERLALSAMPGTARGGFRRLWNKLNAKPKPIYKTIDGKKQIIGYVSYPWEDVQEEREYRGKVWHVIGNPFVWRISFKKYLRQGSEDNGRIHETT